MRLFVAAWPPPEVQAVLRSVPRPERAGLRWMPEESWHVTLRFLGEVSDPAPVIEALRSELSGRGARPASLGDVTSTLGTVLVVRVEGLRSLATLVRLATSRLGDPPRPDPFEGHITVARGGRRGIDTDLVGQAVKTGPSTTWDVGEVALVRTVVGGPTAGPSTTTYETLATIPLT
ncbi:MAG TPA: 2'-5' RNA ligase family protein [Iamia sp.]|jgi:2'-5' RNA ligase|nr:2'-5' RNA ligase family protein [Iamia sp.]